MQAVAEVADWLHNMADFSSRNFVGFDEANFWTQASCRAVAFPEFHHYKRLFDCRLYEAIHGRWPRAGEFPNTRDNLLAGPGET